jgi:OmpA-OmpF porin, OOP family
MAANLLDLLKEHFSEDVIANFASFIGEAPNKLQDSLNTALPALLTGLVEKGSNGVGGGDLFKLLTDGLHDGGILSNLGALSRGGDETKKLLEEGSSLLTSAFGAKADGISNLVADVGGISKASATSLLGFITPVVLGLLGKTLKIENGESVGGLMSFLSGQAGYLKNFAPSGLDMLLTGSAAAATAVDPGEFDIEVSTSEESAVEESAKEEFSIGDTFEKIDDAIEDFARDGVNAAKNAVENVGESIGNISASLIEESKEFADEALSTAKETVSGISESAGKLAADALDSSKDFAKSAADAFEEGSEGGSKLLPLLLIAAALVLMWGLLKSCGKTPEPEQAAAVSEPAVTAPVSPPPVAEPVVAPPAPSAPEPEVRKEETAPAATGNQAFEKKLSTGAVIKASKDGLESKLITFIESNEATAKDLWFNMNGITFDTNRATIKAESMPQINHIAEVLKAYPKVKIKIGGYTDNTGKEDANQKLSGDRAKAVSKVLVNIGIASDRVQAEGYGSQHPVASNDNPEGRQKNRRIDVLILEK